MVGDGRPSPLLGKEGSGVVDKININSIMQHKERINNLPETKYHRRSLRNDATPAEIVLWQYLKKSQVGGLKFRRQHGVGAYVLDFYCPEIKLCIELDGDIHHTPMSFEHDMQRTSYLNNQGITILRYHNEVVFNNVQGIMNSVLHFAERNILLKGYHINEWL